LVYKNEIVDGRKAYHIERTELQKNITIKTKKNIRILLQAKKERYFRSKRQCMNNISQKYATEYSV